LAADGRVAATGLAASLAATTGAAANAIGGQRVAIRVSGLEKRFRDPLSLGVREVLRGVDLTVYEGEVFGLLGVNGAGKTTTLQCLTGLMRPTAGTLEIFDGNPRHAAVRRRIGFLPERPSFYDYLTPIELLDLVARLCTMSPAHRKRRTTELLATLHLERVAKSPLRKLSKGELQRLGIAQSVIHEPDLVIFDEPMSGLDPLGRRDVRDLVEETRRSGRTVIFSSHVVPDVETLCDRVGILDGGRLPRVGRIEEITTVKLREVDVVVRDVPEELLVRLVGPNDTIENLGVSTRVRVRDPERVDRLVVRALQAGGRLVSLERRRERLEDYLVRTASTEEGA
jgi:ABC-2 type transport system ATP-binding protein